MMTFLRTNPAVAAMLLLVVIASVVLTALGIYMTRLGLSLKPVAFMAVLFGLIIGPQAAFHLAQALGAIPRRDLAWTFGSSRPHAGWVEREDALRTEDGRFVDPVAVFGPAAGPDLVSDLRRAGGDSPFAGAEVASMAIVPPTGSAIVARYASPAVAADAASRFLAIAAGVAPAIGADGAQTVTRPQGDVAKVVVAGRTLVVLTGPDDASLGARLRSSRILAPATQATFVPASPVSADAGDFWLYRPVVLIALVLLLVVITSVYFFRGSAWAGTITARDGVQPATERELRERILAVNALDAPFTVANAGNGRMTVTWRFADAKWIDLARAHGMRRTHRIVLDFDERTRTVYPTDEQSRLDWSAGANGGALQWARSTGTVFLQVQHERVFGLQLAARGRFVPKLSYAYTFDVQEMKAPLIAAVTGAGWRWRPTLWRGPRALAWLTG